MTWIDERLKRQKEADARRDKISANAPELYEALWREIESCVNEATKKGIRAFFPDPNPQGGAISYQRQVGLSVLPGPGQLSSAAKKLDVNLSDDKQAIEITGDSKSLTLKLDVGNNKTVLKHDGKAISTAKAAQLILEPFFFEE